MENIIFKPLGKILGDKILGDKLKAEFMVPGEKYLLQPEGVEVGAFVEVYSKHRGTPSYVWVKSSDKRLERIAANYPVYELHEAKDMEKVNV